jgi:L-2-hydroxyglutarate oxidase LhgO
VQERIGVVGAGIVGLAVARRLGQLRPDATVTVFDKETAVASHQTGHNSGVAHSGIYYAPGSLKARLCRRGIGMLRDYCAEHRLPYEERGKLVVARDQLEVTRLRDIESRGRANGVPGLRWLAPGALRELEPSVTGAAALHSPTTAIVDYRRVALSLAADIVAAGGAVRLGSAVTAIRPKGERVEVQTPAGPALLDCLIVCAGLQADLVSALAGDGSGPEIVPFRGEYYRLRPERRSVVHRLIYPVPDPAYPFLGVHITPRADGEVDIGPNAVLALSREGYRRRDVSPEQVRRLLGSPGFRRLARAHWRTGLREMRGSLSRRAFLAAAQTYVPSLSVRDVIRAPSGVRAQALDTDGSLVDDFRIGQAGPVTTVRNAPSPAATSSLAIADYVSERIFSGTNRER